MTTDPSQTASTGPGAGPTMDPSPSQGGRRTSYRLVDALFGGAFKLIAALLGGR
jgi:hypothetical protein